MSGFSLIETMRYEPGIGLLRRDLHRARLKNSAKIFGYDGVDAVLEALQVQIDGIIDTRRVRLELFPDGHHEITTAPFVPLPADSVWHVRVAEASRLNSTDPILRHKTSSRTTYEQARGEFSRDEADEVLLLNEKGEVCEGTITNIFVDDGNGGFFTPPLSSGCLAGILRTSLLCQKKAKNRRLTLDDLKASGFYVGNSLRGLIPARLL